uniref:A18-like helicase n=1 Tax=Pithovirus LCPAC201 TaxID=2506591 RepID=A0A481Z4Y2_9VIRU|nr:MAG: A18-like helicase [Pithovirus LCPAC201]
MSVRLKLSSLNPEERKQFQKDLVFKAKVKPFRGKRRWNFAPPSKDPILGFRIQDGLIRIPLAYGRKNFSDRIIPNMSHVSCPIKFTGSLYNNQIPFVEQGWATLQQKGHTTLALFTGSGKTVVSACLSTYDPGLTLILCESTILLSQWKNTFHAFTDAKVWVVGEPPPAEANVIICMDTRFDKLPIEYLMKIKMVIVDEAHCFPTPTRFPCFLKLEPKYIIAATATPNRADGLFAAIEAVCGKEKIVKISTKPFNVMKYETGVNVKIVQNKQGSPDWAKLVRHLCENEARNKLITDIVVMNLNQGSKILILTWRGDHVIYLERVIASMNISVDRMSGNKRSYHDSDVLIGTIAKIGKAFDEKSICSDFNGIRLDLLLLVGSMNSVELLEQVAGRVFRAQFPSIIHFCDNNHISRKHWSSASEWYISRNGVVSIGKSPLALGNRETPSSKTLALQQLSKYHQRVGSRQHVSNENTPVRLTLNVQPENYNSFIVLNINNGTLIQREPQLRN